jgi:hypothetical protein
LERSVRTDAKPRISYSYLATEPDHATMIASGRLALDIFRRPVLSKVRRAAFSIPASDAEADIVAFIARQTGTNYPPSCNCAIGGASTRISRFSVLKDSLWAMRRA